MSTLASWSFLALRSWRVSSQQRLRDPSFLYSCTRFKRPEQGVKPNVDG